MPLEPIELEGEHVRIVPMTREHIPGLFEAGLHSEIWELLPSRMETAADMDAIVTEALRLKETGSEFPFVILDRASGNPIGSSRYMDISIPHRNLEIGWTWLTPGVWRTGVNTECKLLLLSHAFDDLGMIRVMLKTDLRNTRSQTAIERIGGVREGVLRSHRILPDGYIRDTVVFSIIEREWPDVRRRLKEMKARGAG